MSVKHAYQYQLLRSLDHPAVDQILHLPRMVDAMHCARTLIRNPSHMWETTKLEFMHCLLMEKFYLCPEYREILLSHYNFVEDTSGGEADRTLG